MSVHHPAHSYQLPLRRFIAAFVDFFIEMGGGCLGGYFGAMLAALVLVLHEVTPEMTQKAIWTGMVSGFVFWSLSVSWINRVLIQGMSRASIGKKIMDIEIISVGEPISWKLMMQHWLSVSLLGPIRVVSSMDSSNLAQVYSIQQKSSPQSDTDKKAA